MPSIPMAWTDGAQWEAIQWGILKPMAVVEKRYGAQDYGMGQWEMGQVGNYWANDNNRKALRCMRLHGRPVGTSGKNPPEALCAFQANFN